MRKLVSWPSRFVAIAVAGAAVVVLTQCKKDVTAPRKVAVGNTVVPIQTATVRAVEATTFTFANGGAVLAPSLANKTFTIAFTNTSAANPTTTVVVAGAGGGQFTASTTFGSCIFVVTTSTFAAGTGPQVGNTITVNPCQVNVSTGGVQATGQATTVQILLQLGLIPSAAQQSQVSISPTGVVTVNGVNTGQTVTLTTATGLSG